MNLVGELVLARNQILQFTKALHDSTLVSTSQRLNLITSELQEGVMRTRMQPISNVWSKFPRIIRDVSRACGKQVRLDMEGKETDLDKTIIESIKDPLTHLVRNSIDHGIETPEIRKSRGKNPEGRLLLRAYHEGGHVMIEISDDGGGLNTEKIRAKALERGLITAEKASRMSDSEVNRLIFLPGFSTADAVTNISGRGVGMDVVRSNIERIGGVVDLASTLGHGTTIKIKIPLTLAIVPALIVSLMGQRYAIPQVSLLELVRVQEKDFAKTIESIHGAEFYRLRGNLLPLVYLDTELKLRSMDRVSERNLERGLNIVVVRADTKVVGLVVDAVHDTEEIVVKPLSKQLKSLAVFAGATIMGDGCVALILDVLGIARKAGVLGDESIKEDQKDGSGSGDADKSGEVEKESLLIVELAKGGRGAIQLSMVNRLEEFQSSTIENAAGRSVVQYRGGILPLVDLRRIYGLESSRLPERIPVVVYQHGDQLVGCIVSRILDIVEERIVVQFPGSREGVRGAMVIQKLVTDLIDLDAAMKIERCVAPQLSVQGDSEAGALV